MERPGLQHHGLLSLWAVPYPEWFGIDFFGIMLPMWLAMIVWGDMTAGIAASVVVFGWDLAANGFGSFTPVVAKYAAEGFFFWAVFCLLLKQRIRPLHKL